jgi:predicted ATPase
MLACWGIGIMCFHLGEFTTARIYQEKGVLLYDPAHRPSYSELVPHDARVLLRLHSSWSLACLGHLDQALFQREMAVDEARRLSHPATLAVAVGGAWTTGSFVRLEPGSLLRYADETMALATEHGLEFYRALALIERGWCLAALGRADEGIPILSAGLADMVELGFIVYRPRYLTLLGDAYRMAGQWHAALDHLTEARRLAEATEERCFQAETVRLSGDVLTAMGDRACAEATYSEAIAIAQRQSAKLWELRGATSLARLWRDQGRRTEARDLLAPVYSWFTESLETADLKEAKGLLDKLT